MTEFIEYLMQNTLLLGVVIFITRVLDVSIGTIRTISIVHGRSITAFILGFVEVTMWLLVVAILVPLIAEQPLLILFYSLGFSTGNVVGIWLEKRLALGHAVTQIFSRHHGDAIAQAIREAGHRASVFRGRGREGDVDMIMTIGSRKHVSKILKVTRRVEKDVFFTTAPIGSVRRLRTLIGVDPTGWRAIFKKK